jgi:hypothetical protein
MLKKEQTLEIQFAGIQCLEIIKRFAFALLLRRSGRIS